MEVDAYWQGKRRVKGGRGGVREQHGCFLRIQKQGRHGEIGRPRNAKRTLAVQLVSRMRP